MIDCLSLSVCLLQVVCQLGGLICDCSVIYFPDKCGSMCVMVAARVMTSVTAVGGGLGGCVVRWLWTFTPFIYIFLLFGWFCSCFFFFNTGTRGVSQDAFQDDVVGRCNHVSRLLGAL